MKNFKLFVLRIILSGMLLAGCAGALPKIHSAGRTGNFRTIKELVESGVSVNLQTKNGSTPLQFAAVNGHLDAVKTLLELGADPNKADYWGRTAISNASSPEIFSLLVAKGARVGVKSKNAFGDTPLHRVMGFENAFELASILLNAGADPNEKDRVSFTPLHFAAGYGKEKLVSFLIENGADVNAKNIQGLTARDVACVMGIDNVVAVLDKHGGKSMKYFHKDETKAQVNDGQNYGGIDWLHRSGLATQPGLGRYTFWAEWSGEGLAVVKFSGIFFREPGKTYRIDIFGGDARYKTYGTIRDEATGDIVGYFQ